MRVVMTIDAVGGVWRYGVDLARHLGEAGLVGGLQLRQPGRQGQQRESLLEKTNDALGANERGGVAIDEVGLVLGFDAA